jgi:hypothetical protein
MMERNRLAYIILVILLAAATAGVLALAPQAARSQSVAAAQATPTWQQVNSNGFGVQQTDGVTALAGFNGYLYAGTSNATDGARIWRSPDGTTWTPMTQPGFGIAHDIAPPVILDFTVFNGGLFAGTGRGDGPGQIWSTGNGVYWAPMVIHGFADPDNVDVAVLAEYDGVLYAGVTNLTTGAQIWRSSSGGSNSWEQVAPAAPGTATAGVTGMAVFDGALYAAVQSAAPAQIWRSYGGGATTWETMVSDGFGDTQTTLTGGMAEFGGALYAGAGNTSRGAQVWRTGDGATWEQANPDGFGDANNQKVEQLFVFQNQLYAGVQNAVTGIELWRSADGALWEQVNPDGFGDSANTAVNGVNAAAAYLDRLYLGTTNAVGGELWRMQRPYGVALSPDAALAGPPGGQVIYTLAVTNTSELTDTVDLTVTGQLWTATLSTSVAGLAPAAGAPFSVTVTIPPGAANLATDTATVTATSRGDGSKTAAAILTSTSVAAPVDSYGVDLSPDAALAGPPGEQVVYSLTITNTGAITDSFDLTATGQSWATGLVTSVTNLAPAAVAVFPVTVTIPLDAAGQVSDTVTITATSHGDGSIRDTTRLTSTRVATPIYGVALSPDASLAGPAGGQVIYTLTVTNTGNVVDTFDLLLTVNSWTAQLARLDVTLAPGARQAVSLTVTIPPTVTALTSEQDAVEARSRHDPGMCDTAVLTTVSTGQPVNRRLLLVLLTAP